MQMQLMKLIINLKESNLHGIQ